MHRLTARELRERFTSGQLSAESIATHFLNRIHRLDSQIGAFLRTLDDRVMAKAKALDEKRRRGEPLGKLAAIPIAVKDNIHIEGEISTCASRFLSNYRAPFSATVTHLMEAEDALLIGKTNMDEFAMGSSTEHSAYNPVRNPWNLDYVPGGSSGGSAAAVAARLVPLAIGSDTGGSIRQPAAFCGIVGHKPTYGRVSRFGLVAFGSSLDQIGPLATNTADVALLMEVLARHCPRDSTSLPRAQEPYLQGIEGASLKGVSVGIPTGLVEGLKGEVLDNWHASLDKIRKAGGSTVEVDLDIMNYSVAVYYILATAEASTNLARFDGIRYGVRSERATTLDEVFDYSREEGFGAEVKRRILLGTFVLSSGYQDAYYKKAQKVRTLMIQAFEAAFKQCQVVAMPTATTAAFGLGAVTDPLEMYLADLFTIPANLAGVPALSIPSGFTREHLPMGIQFFGPQGEDGRVLRLAHAFEQLDAHGALLPPFAREES